MNTLCIHIFRLEDARNWRQADREQINKLNQQLADYESEISMLRRTVESLETERGRDKANINRLQQEVDKLRIVSTCKLDVTPTPLFLVCSLINLDHCFNKPIFINMTAHGFSVLIAPTYQRIHSRALAVCIHKVWAYMTHIK